MMACVSAGNEMPQLTLARLRNDSRTAARPQRAGLTPERCEMAKPEARKRRLHKPPFRTPQCSVDLLVLQLTERDDRVCCVTVYRKA